MSLAHKARAVARAYGPRSDQQISQQDAERIALKSSKELERYWKEFILKYAALGYRERTFILGNSVDPVIRFEESYLRDWLTREGFTYEIGTTHFRTEERGEYEVHRHLLVKW